MILIAAAAIAASTPTAAPVRSPAAVVQARASVRIISGVRLRLDGQPNRDAPAARETVIRTGGTARPVRLIEFE